MGNEQVQGRGDGTREIKKTERVSWATIEEICNEADCSGRMDSPSISAIATSSDAGCEALFETRPTSYVYLIRPFRDHFLLEQNYRLDSK